MYEIPGSEGRDTISGAGGDDLVYGGDWADLLYGGDGTTDLAIRLTGEIDLVENDFVEPIASAFKLAGSKQ